ncbi:hypothetical protein CLAIMM_12471, partial [Cladophialophora immunda]
GGVPQRSVDGSDSAVINSLIGGSDVVIDLNKEDDVRHASWDAHCLRTGWPLDGTRSAGLKLPPVKSEHHWVAYKTSPQRHGATREWQNGSSTGKAVGAEHRRKDNVEESR